MLRLLAGAAALAMAATPIHAQPGKNDNNGKGKPAAAAKAGGQGKAKRGGLEKARGKPERAASKADRGPDPKVDRGGGKPDVARSNNRGNRGQGNAPEMRGNRDRGPDYVRGNGKGKSGGIDYRDGDFAGGILRDALGINRGVIDGCPPGLAKKRNGCLPPGQAKKRYSSYRPDFFGLRGLGSGNYYYDDGYLLRYGASGLAGYIPLLGGALSIGNSWPSYYQPSRLPDYHVNYYGLGGYDSYRYADNVVYRVNPETAAITSIAAMLTGDDISIGQPMPAGYDVYNVPYSYRDRYYDSPQARYRYADGYVYRIDPETALVTAAIDLLI